MYSKFTFFISIIALLCVISCSNNDNLPLIGIAELSEDVVLKVATESAVKALNEAGFVDGKNIRIKYQNAQGELSNIQMILKSFQADKAKLIITNSTPCMAAAAGNIKEIPTVFTVAFGPDQIGIIAPDNLYGVYDPLDMDNFLELMIECIPGLQKIGMPYNPSEPNAELAAKKLLESCNRKSIQLIIKSVSNPNEIIPTVQSLVGEGVDVLVGAADNTVYMGLESVGEIASKNKIPLFVTDPYQAKKGAAIGFGINYEEWGRTSGEIAVKILKNEHIEGAKIKPLTSYQMIINNNAAKRQGLIIPENILQRASLVIE